MSAPLRTGSERMMSDFSVRIYQTEDGRARVEVEGTHTGRMASATCYGGLTWVFALLRALKAAGGYPKPPTPTRESTDGNEA